MAYNLLRSAQTIAHRLRQVLQSSSPRRLKTLQANFDQLFGATAIRVKQDHGWLASAYRPSPDNPDGRWAYRLYSSAGLQDYGLLNLRLKTVDGRGLVKRYHIKEVENLLKAVVDSYRRDKLVPAVYGASLSTTAQ